MKDYEAEEDATDTEDSIDDPPAVFLEKPSRSIVVGSLDALKALQCSAKKKTRCKHWSPKLKSVMK